HAPKSRPTPVFPPRHKSPPARPLPPVGGGYPLSRREREVWFSDQFASSHRLHLKIRFAKTLLKGFSPTVQAPYLKIRIPGKQTKKRRISFRREKIQRQIRQRFRAGEQHPRLD